MNQLYIEGREANFKNLNHSQLIGSCRKAVFHYQLEVAPKLAMIRRLYFLGTFGCNAYLNMVGIPLFEALLNCVPEIKPVREGNTLSGLSRAHSSASRFFGACATLLFSSFCLFIFLK